MFSMALSNTPLYYSLSPLLRSVLFYFPTAWQLCYTTLISSPELMLVVTSDLYSNLVFRNEICNRRDYVVDLSAEDCHPTVSLTLHFDQLCVSVMVSVTPSNPSSSTKQY